VTSDERDAEVSKIAAEVEGMGTTMVAVADSAAAAEHAASIGLISPDAPDRVRAKRASRLVAAVSHLPSSSPRRPTPLRATIGTNSTFPRISYANDHGKRRSGE
jgi:hypothetical protein